MTHLKRRGGFTLVECLVATVILGIGVVGVAGMFASATLSERKAAHMAQAREIAEKTLEEVRAGGYGVFSQPSGVVSIPTPDLPHSTGELAWQPYPDSSSDQGLKLVSLNLSWSWAGSTSGEYRVATLAAEQTTW
ncbi:MAG: prepilin-type N-terminal cleavage/methylation domain-containing protein [Armatimonadota bacterium]|nr:MAG: prepilin-type N-terminal cleavage/methylation domain-containing protein [Armatimonadota bacterium]